MSISGSVGVMSQFVGSVRDGTTIRQLLVSVSGPAIRQAQAQLDEAELAMMERDDTPAQMAYAAALSHWGDVGGYDAEVLFDICTTAALGVSMRDRGHREASTLSGGEQKRIVLEALLRGRDDLLLLDEPDNYLDVPGKGGSRSSCGRRPKTVLYISHDRELLADGRPHRDRQRAARRGPTAAASRPTTTPERPAIERLDEMLRRWTEERDRLASCCRPSSSRRRSPR